MDNIPEPLKDLDINWNNLKATCKEYLEYVLKGIDDDDIPHFIFEEAMEAVYGKDIWKWVNRKLN